MIVQFILKYSKRIILLVVFIVAIIILYCYGKVQALSKVPQGENMIFTVKLNSIELVENNSVGNDWGFQATINNSKITEGNSFEVTAKIDDTINLSGRAEEYDTIPDIGINSTIVKIKDLKLSNKNNYPVEVTVTENRGRYSGNSAVWKFNYEIQRKVTLSDIVRSIFDLL